MKLTQEQFNAIVHYAVLAHEAIITGDKKASRAAYTLCQDRYLAATSGNFIFGAEAREARRTARDILCADYISYSFPQSYGNYDDTNRHFRVTTEDFAKKIVDSLNSKHDMNYEYSSATGKPSLLRHFMEVHATAVAAGLIIIIAGIIISLTAPISLPAIIGVLAVTIGLGAAVLGWNMGPFLSDISRLPKTHEHNEQDPRRGSVTDERLATDKLTGKPEVAPTLPVEQPESMIVNDKDTISAQAKPHMSPQENKTRRQSYPGGSIFHKPVTNDKLAENDMPSGNTAVTDMPESSASAHNMQPRGKG